MKDLYLNHAATSWPKPRAVTEAVREAMSIAPRRWPNRFDQAHRSIAAFFGLSRPEQLLLTPGCTSALAVGVGDAVVQAGKRVLTSHWEHHALYRPLSKLSEVRDVTVEQIPTKNTPGTEQLESPLDLQWLESALSQGDVAMVAITAASNVTGELLPYKDVVALSHQHGANVLIDAAQIVGWIALDLPSLGADIVAFGGHKGLQGPWGIGGLYLSERIDMECVAATCTLPEQGNGAFKKQARPGYCDVGSVDQYALAGLHAAMEVLGQQNADSNLQRARAQIERIRKALSPLEQVEFFRATDERIPSLALRVPKVPSAQLASRFAEQGVVVGSGLHCAPLAHETLGTADSGLVRLSAGIGQTDHEIDEAIDRMLRVLAAVC